MTTLVGTPEHGLQSAFGAPPRSVTITAPTSGNSLGLWVYNEANVAMDTVTCGNGTPTRLYSFTHALYGYVLEFWIITNITDSPTTVVGAWTGSNNFFNVNKCEFQGVIQQHNAQEGFVTGTSAAEIGPSLTSTASSVGAMGIALWNGDRSLTPATGLSVLPAATVTFRHLVYSDNLGAAGTYVIGGTPNSTAADHYIGGVLLESVGSGPVIPVIAAGLQRMMNN